MAEFSPLRYVDFAPTKLQEQGAMSDPVYDKFDVLMQRANSWLAANPGVKAKMCETLKIKVQYKAPSVDTETPLYREGEKGLTMLVKILRLWLIVNDSKEPQQLGYLNIQPGVVKESSTFRAPTYEPFGNCIAHLNNMIKQNPLPGPILNVETLGIELNGWNEVPDPDSSWTKKIQVESSDTFILNVVRVFYEKGPAFSEEIAFVDFVPACLEQGGFRKLPKFQSFAENFKNASQWIQQQQGIDLINIQSVNSKLGDHHAVDTQVSLFYESTKFWTPYINVVRIIYSHPEKPPQVLPQMSYKTFLPASLSGVQQYQNTVLETMNQNMQRVSAWINHTGAKVLFVETVPFIFTYKGLCDPEDSYSHKDVNFYCDFVFGFRVYLEGQYKDPSPDAVPPSPDQLQIAVSNTCNIM